MHVKSVLKEQQFFISASLIPREMETYVKEISEDSIIIGNRGATGIDGIIASSIITAKARDTSLLCLIGDQATLHDLSSLQHLQSLNKNALVVVINNSGGGIFNFTKKTELKDTLINRHNISFKEISLGFGLEYSSPSTQNEFIYLFKNSFLNKDKPIKHLIEIKVDGIESVSNLSW